MLRRTASFYRVGDFLTSIPTDTISRAIFTLGSGAVTAPRTSPEEKRCEDFARELMAHFHAVAQSSSALRRVDAAGNSQRSNNSSSSSLLLGVEETLLRSPLARAAGVSLPSGGGGGGGAKSVLAWASPHYSARKIQSGGTIISAWVGRSAAQATAAVEAKAPLLVLMSPHEAQRETCFAAADDGAVSFVEATAVSSERNGRVLLQLKQATTDSNYKSSSNAAGKEEQSKTAGDEDPGKKHSALLLSVQARLNHAAFAFGTLRAIARDAVLAGATATSFRSGFDSMPDSCGVFLERLASIEASSHMLLAAAHFTAFQVAETLYVPRPSSTSTGSSSKSVASTSTSSSQQDFARDLMYDSGLLHLLSRTVLRNAHQQAERTFLHHGPLILEQQQQQQQQQFNFIGHSFRGALHWINSVQNIDTSEQALCEAMAAHCCGSAAVQAALGKASSRSPVMEQMRKVASKIVPLGGGSGGSGSNINNNNNAAVGGGGAGGGGVFSDVHMNIQPVASRVLTDFDRIMVQIAGASSLSSYSSASASSPAGQKNADSSNSKSGSSTPATTKKSNNLLEQPAYSTLIMPLAAEMLGSACALYHSTNSMEVLEALQQDEKPESPSTSASSAASAAAPQKKNKLSASDEAAIRELYPGAAPAPAPLPFVYRSPAEAAAVAWLSLEVALEASKQRRAQLMRELELSSSLCGTAVASSLAAHKSTHPVELPRSEQKKQPLEDEQA